MQVKQSREDLLRLLEPGSADESYRADMIMHHAAHGPKIQDKDLCGLDADAAQRLRALQVLQGALGGGPIPEALPVGSPTVTASTSMVKREEQINGFSVHELIIHVGRNGPKLRLYEAIDSQKATRFFEENGHKDPFGCKAWPSAYLVAERLLGENLKGSSVLELGCGTGLVSIAAKLGGASQVLATDQARLNLDLAQRSAALNEVDLDVEVFDVTSEAPLPRFGSKAFDYVVFSDVLYWPAEAIAFAKRAAEAFGAGSTVIMADPGRRREDFLGTLRVELEQRVVDPAFLPRVAPEPTTFPERVFDWVSSEVKTASSLFCQEPFILTLRPKTSFCADGIFEIVD